MMRDIKIGLIGIGTVGGGTFALLQRNGEEIMRRSGQNISIRMVADRNLAEAHRIVAGTATEVVDDAFALVKHADISIVVELIGGTTLAKDLVLAAIACGKHVVTANKALLAQHGAEIFNAAHSRGVIVAFEAAVAGGIPIIKALREGMAANRIRWVAGIINGTTNFILSEMRAHGTSFSEALAEAQNLGYAEADPSFDVEGIDAAHKLTLLSAVAFGVPLQFSSAYTEGISQLESLDIRYAEELGYRVKLLGITKRLEMGIELRVHPTLIPEKRLIANVDGVMNAVLVMGDAVGPTLYYGAGAGAQPTASAVVADIIDVARLMNVPSSARVPMLGFQSLQALPVLPIEAVYSAYYLRMRALDKPGVLAAVTATLGQRNISIEALLQKEPSADADYADIVMLTSVTEESEMNHAIASLQALSAVCGEIVKIRVESLGR